jgi:anti-sigma B factor antagonist
VSVYSVDTAVFGERCELIVSGQIDLCSADEVAALGALGLTERGVRTLVVRMKGVTFIDSTGIGALIRIRNIALEFDKRLVLSEPSERVLKIFEITGLDTVFTIDLTPAPLRSGDGGEAARSVRGRSVLRRSASGDPDRSSVSSSSSGGAAEAT